MKEAIVSASTCLKCGSKNMDLVTINGSIIKYSSYLSILSKDEVKDKLSNYQLYKFKCRECGHTSSIDWRFGLPCPTEEKADF